MKKDFYLYRGRTFTLGGLAQDEDENLYDLSSPAALQFYMKHTSEEDELTLTTDDSISVVGDPTAGVYAISFAAEDTSELKPGFYDYEIVYIPDSGADPQQPVTLNPTRLQQGRCELVPTLIEVS